MAHERTPALGRRALAWTRVQMPGDILVHGTRRDPQAQLELQFVGDAPLTPREVVACHLPDERVQLSRNRGPSKARCAAPALLAPLATPPLKRLRLYHRQSQSPVKPLRQPDQGETGGIGGTPRYDIAPLIEGSLFTQEEVFRCQSSR
jgi:hypothetical protein